MIHALTTSRAVPSRPGLLRSVPLLLCLLPGSILGASAQTSHGMSASLSLKPTYGGAIVQGRVNVSKADELTGVWSSIGRARLMKCMPRCQVVSSLPVQGRLVLNGDSSYRVVLGGKVTPGQRVSLVLRLRGGLILNVMASAAR